MFAPSHSYLHYQPLPDMHRARAKRAQWLPDEYDHEDEYGSYQLNPHERAYMNAYRNHALMERKRLQMQHERAEARRRELEESKWQQELNKRQKEDEGVRRLEVEREMRRQLQQQQRTPSEDRSTPRTIPILSTDNHIPSHRPQAERAAEPSAQQPPVAPQYSEKYTEAASTLQRCFRVRRSVRLIQSLSSEFDALRHNFTYPSTISFQKSDSPPSSIDVVDVTAVSTTSTDDLLDVNVKIPKLAFNSTNYALLAYNEALDKLLVKLDGVESWGDAAVRMRRREVVKKIEEEQSCVDRFWRTSWLKNIKEQGQRADGDMSLDIPPLADTPAVEVGMEEPVHEVEVDLPSEEDAKQ